MAEMKEPARRYGVALAAQPQRCGAKTRAEDAHPCKQYAVEGATRCKWHGGRSPQSLRKARERIAEERAAAVLRTQPAEPVTDAVAALRRLCAEVLRNADAQLEAGQITGSTTGEWIDRASRLLVELAKIEGAYINRSEVLLDDVRVGADLDRQIEEIYGNLISKATQARLNVAYDAIEAGDTGQDVDAAIEKGIETRRKIPASLLRNDSDLLEDVPQVSVEAFEITTPADTLPVMGLGSPPPANQIDDTTDEPAPNVVRIGRLPSAFGSRRPHPPAS